MAPTFSYARILVSIGIVLISIAISIVLNYYMIRNSDYIQTRIG